MQPNAQAQPSLLSNRSDVGLLDGVPSISDFSVFHPADDTARRDSPQDDS